MTRFVGILVLLGSITLSLMVVRAQAPTPPLVVVQPAGASTPVPNANLPASAQTSPALQEAIKVLVQVKAANDDTLKKQEAELQGLDEMQKAADQLKIFSRRTGG